MVINRSAVAADPGIVGDQHQRLSGVAQLGEQPEDLVGRVAVEVAGRFVGQHHQGLVDQRPGQRHPLQLPAGEPVGQVSRPVGHIQPFEQLGRTSPCRPPGRADQQRRELDVLDGGELVDKVERLEHEPDRAAPQLGPCRLRQPVDALVAQGQRAGVGSLQPTQQVQQGGLAAPARSHDRHGLALLDGQVDTVDGANRHTITPEVAAQTLGPHDSAHRVLPVHRYSHASSQRMSACNRSADPSSSSPLASCGRLRLGEPLDLPQSPEQLAALGIDQRHRIGEPGPGGRHQLEMELDRRHLRPRRVQQPRRHLVPTRRGHLVHLLVRRRALRDLHPPDQPRPLQARQRHIHLPRVEHLTHRSQRRRQTLASS